MAKQFFHHLTILDIYIYCMTLRPLTEHHLEFLSLKGGCTCSSEVTLVIIWHCWKSHVAAYNFLCG